MSGTGRGESGLRVTEGPRPRPRRRRILNDAHSRLNATEVAAVLCPRSTQGLGRIVTEAADLGTPISVGGARHAMGGQQFGARTLHLDTRRMNRVLEFDGQRGHVHVQAGIQWPELVDACRRLQRREPRPWVIRQKQTGADRLTLGGALSANIHGRGLGMRPIIDDVESFTLVDPGGNVRECSRSENADLFALAIGGYGLFGVIASVRLRLMPLEVLRRDVALMDAEAAEVELRRRARGGSLYGDFQFAIDPARDDFLRAGILSCYSPLSPGTPVPPGQHELAASEWMGLLRLAHTDKHEAFCRYSGHYLRTDGQLYHSDAAQLGVYIDGYHACLESELGLGPSGEMITELYVPPGALGAFMAGARRVLRTTGADPIYGTVRIIRRDVESFLSWARRDFTCIVLNLHVAHDRASVEKAATAFRGLIDEAAGLGGSFYLTYHRFATRAQVAACHPKFGDFLEEKRRIDPAGLFASEWHRHYESECAG